MEDKNMVEKNMEEKNMEGKNIEDKNMEIMPLPIKIKIEPGKSTTPSASSIPRTPEADNSDKNDGMYLIIEPGYKLETLRQYIMSSCLAKKLKFVETIDSIAEICQRSTTILRTKDLNLDELTSMFVVASICFHVNATPETVDWRSHFLQRTFQYSDTLSPMHLHLATKRLWNALKTDDIGYAFNLLILCHNMAVASETGRAVSICLAWALLYEITETKVDMYSFHEFPELIKTLNELDDQLLPKEENIRIVYILVQCIGFLVNTIIFGMNDDYKKAGYRNYFSYHTRDLEKIRRYACRLCNLLKVNISSAENNFELRMTITEYLNVDIIGVLQEKITEMHLSK